MERLKQIWRPQGVEGLEEPFAHQRETLILGVKDCQILETSDGQPRFLPLYDRPSTILQLNLRREMGKENLKLVSYLNPEPE